ncbi:hypothetical protein MTsPCn5_15160 [Croceitalea sp. MTPC5]|uniref:hypothetical protein n=1 Tax=Croceitalea sp. MTPC5 TaxID=3056565 RepID=UPI002B38C39A|nr:hypothetical protein MTsPCn5_15160 [Croceitalea sp. MTPC5]
MIDLSETINICLQMVEKKFDKGSSEHWSTLDFENLANEIHSKSGTLLSVSTLKRIWGRVNHNVKPNQTTLNALAKYLGFEDWIAFLKSQKLSERNIERKNAVGNKTIVLFVFVLIVLGVFFLFKNKGSDTVQPLEKKEYSFESKVVSDDIPNTVVFKYDASKAPEGTKVEIQQSWDKRKRSAVKKEDSIATSIYYRPGYFKAKLVINDTIVKEDDVYIPTKNWLGLIETNPEPIYLDPQDIYKNDFLSIDRETVSKYVMDSQKQKNWVGLYNVREFGELYIDDFEMETLVQNTWKHGPGICQNIRIAILYDGGAVVVPLGKKGCSAELSIMSVDDKIIDGKTNDLSSFGVYYDEFVNVVCKSKNGQLKFTINKDQVFTIDIPKRHKKIIGIVYNFEGSGSIKKLEFKKDNTILFQEKFKNK